MKSISSRHFIFLFSSLLLLAPQLRAEQQNTNTQNASSVSVNRPAAASKPPASIFASDPNSDPFAEMERVQEGMNKVFKESIRRVKNYQQAGKSFEPDADFLEQNGQYFLKVDLPGMTKEKINIEVAENVIVISGERQTERQYKSTKDGSSQFERSSGSFYRRMSLPADAQTDKIQAKYENGVLEVSMPKINAGSAQKKKVVIQ